MLHTKVLINARRSGHNCDLGRRLTSDGRWRPVVRWKLRAMCGLVVSCGLSAFHERSLLANYACNLTRVGLLVQFQSTFHILQLFEGILVLYELRMTRLVQYLSLSRAHQSFLGGRLHRLYRR